MESQTRTNYHGITDYDHHGDLGIVTVTMAPRWELIFLLSAHLEMHPN